MKKEELESKGYKAVRDARFMVNKDGDIYSLCDTGEYRKAKLFLNKKKYKAVSCFVGNKQYQVYLHRALAEAFLPNPENYKYVLFKDGDSANVTLDNIEWGNGFKRNEIYEKMHKIYGCSICGSKKNLSTNPNYMCAKCKRTQQYMQRRIDKAQKAVGDVPYEQLSDRQRKVYDLWCKGVSATEIAAEIDCSRQTVYRIINRIKSLKEKGKLSDEQRKIYDLWCKGVSVKEIVAEMGCNRSSVYHTINKIKSIGTEEGR